MRSESEHSEAEKEQKKSSSFHSEDEEKETSRLTLIEILWKLIEKLKEEIFILGVIFCLLVAIIVIFSGQFPAWAAFTFITIYLIAAACYIYPKIREERKKIEDETSQTVSIKWTLSRPPAFQDPLQIALKQPSLRIVYFDLVFNVRNLSKIAYRLKIYVKSTTQAVCFPLDSPIKVWRRAYGIVPYREEVEFSLDNVIEQAIIPEGEANYVFHAWYRPLFAFRDFQLKRSILIVYRFLVVSEDEKWRVDFHEHRIEIPFQKEVEYMKE